MDQIISLLTSLLNLTKLASVSIPGLLTALALALLAWPPPPLDVIPVVTPNKTEQVSGDTHGAACDISLAQLSSVPEWLGAHQEVTNIDFPGGPASLNSRRGPASLVIGQSAVADQLVLEEQKVLIAGCMEIETSLKRAAKAEQDQLSTDLAAREKERTAAEENYIASKAKFPNYSRRGIDEAEEQIQPIRTKILSKDDSLRFRQRNIDALTRYASIISERLADPGRLRPRKSFDEYLAALTNRVIAFILLSIALGVVLTPVTRAFSGLFYDRFSEKF